MNSQELLADLATHTRVALKPSPVHGIGVFAIADIPAGYDQLFSRSQGGWIRIPVTDVEKLPAHSRMLVGTYCLYDANDYFVPEYGFKIMDLVNYLNHSSTPNVQSVNDGEYFEATRDIKAGEELLVDYNSIVETSGYD